MNIDEQTMWSSHIPAIMACVAVTDGPVCEVGCGNFSTPLLHAVCISMNRKLVTLESDQGWRSRFSYLASGLHRIWPLKNNDPRPERRWSVVFLDQSREAWTRADSFKVFIDNTDFIVCHDFHRENEEEMMPLLKGIPYHITKHQDPPTLIASKTRALPRGVLDL